MDSQTLNQIREAIKQALDKGLSKEDVHDFMVKSGYSEEDVDEAFKTVQHSSVEDLKRALEDLEEPEETKQAPEEEPKAFESGKRICPQCGYVNGPTGNFCGGCGKKL